MRAGNSLDTVLAADLVQQSSGAAIGIGDEHVPDTLGARFPYLAFHFIGNSVWMIVQDGGQAGEGNMVQPVRCADRDDLASDCPAGNDADLVSGIMCDCGGHGEPCSMIQLFVRQIRNFPAIA